MEGKETTKIYSREAAKQEVRQGKNGSANTPCNNPRLLQCGRDKSADKGALPSLIVVEEHDTGVRPLRRAQTGGVSFVVFSRRKNYRNCGLCGYAVLDDRLREHCVDRFRDGSGPSATMMRNPGSSVVPLVREAHSQDLVIFSSKARKRR